MKKFFAALSFTAVLLTLPAGVMAEKLVFATADWPPYIMRKEGKPSGLNTETVLELCRRLGFEAEIRILPWKRALMYVRKGEADAVFAPRKTEERAKFMYYMSEPLNMERTVIVARKGSGIRAKRLDDLKGKVVGVVRGYTYGPELDNYQGFQRKDPCRDDRQMVKKFASSRFPLIVSSDEGVSKYLCKQAGVEIETVYVLSEIPSYIAFSRTLGEKGKTLAEKFSRVLRELKEEGVVRKIEAEYF